MNTYKCSVITQVETGHRRLIGLCIPTPFWGPLLLQRTPEGGQNTQINQSSEFLSACELLLSKQ